MFLSNNPDDPKYNHVKVPPPLPPWLTSRTTSWFLPPLMNPARPPLSVLSPRLPIPAALSLSAPRAGPVFAPAAPAFPGPCPPLPGHAPRRCHRSSALLAARAITTELCHTRCARASGGGGRSRRDGGGRRRVRMGGGAGARLIKVSGLSSGLSSVAGQVCDLGLASKVKDMSTMMQTICGTVCA